MTSLGLGSLYVGVNSFDMTGVMVTWNQKEIHAIDEDDFESAVVNVIEEFFNGVDEYRGVIIEWETPTRNHDCVYRVSEAPLVHLDRSRCFIDIVGEQRGGEYKIDLKPSGFEIITRSSGRSEELTFLQLRPEGVAINPKEQEMFLQSIPESIKNRIVSQLPDR
jgi:hypothetical protein